MVLNKFYTVEASSSAAGAIRASLLINRTHPIFDGHFPEVPVVPGVCMIQMIKEVVEQTKKVPYNLITGDNIKFIAVLNPDEHPKVEVSIQLEQNNNLAITASLFAGEVTFLKLKAVLEERT